MKERDDTVYLKHILDTIARIEGYLLPQYPMERHSRNAR